MSLAVGRVRDSESALKSKSRDEGIARDAGGEERATRWLECDILEGVGVDGLRAAPIMTQPEGSIRRKDGANVRAVGQRMLADCGDLAVVIVAQQKN